jgi:hypothetical protein
VTPPRNTASSITPRGPGWGQRWRHPSGEHRDHLLSIEYEGDEHRTDPQRFRRDIARRERLADAGWRTIRVTEADLHGRAAHDLVALVARCLSVSSLVEWSSTVLRTASGSTS